MQIIHQNYTLYQTQISEIFKTNHDIKSAKAHCRHPYIDL